MENIKEFEATAKLSLPESERKTISGKAEMLIKSFNELENAGADGLEPMVTVLDIQNVLRRDVSVKKFTREEMLKNAPEQYDGYFQAPKTID